MKEVGEGLGEFINGVKSELNKNRTDFSDAEGIYTTVYLYKPNQTMPTEFPLDKSPEIHNNGWVSFWSGGKKYWVSSDNIVIVETPVEK